jgi:thiamine-monophosphate kinase
MRLPAGCDRKSSRPRLSNGETMTPRGAKRPGEFALIARYFQPLAKNSPGALALVDDAACYRPRPGFELVLTLDTIAANVHFAVDDPPASIARKALRVNLSDLAAKGAKPVGYLLSLALPGDWTERWVEQFAEGLARDQRTYGLALLGGDTTRSSGGLTITITAIGELPAGEMVLRSGARPGDAIFVSGTIGDAALGLALRRGDLEAPEEKLAAHLEERYLHPRPRVTLAPVLRRHANSAMDISDGLVGDLAHICEASGVGAEVEVPCVPLSPAARSLVAGNDAALKVALTGGDDYEILATVFPGKADEFVREAVAAGVRTTRIGSIVKGGGGPLVLDERRAPITFAGSGYTHF